MLLQNLNKLKARKILGLGHYDLAHVGDITKPFFVTVGCSHARGLGVPYKDSWSNKIGDMFGLEHVNISYDGSSIDYQFDRISKLDSVLPGYKFVLWMHTYPVRSHNFKMAKLLGDRYSRIGNYILTEEYNKSFAKVKNFVERSHNKIMITNCWGYDDQLKIMIRKKICPSNPRYFFNSNDYEDRGDDNVHAGANTQHRLANDWHGHIVKHLPDLLR